MASFTDQISQFNPYIQELPVEAMAQVGMAKQAQYDQGVKKVQNYIDRVAGLEIAKPQHKQYLQSKMDELGNRLKTVAAGDFSNQQLVNSVSGMTGQIIKDPIVQTAVYSTQVLKKGEADREVATKAGKSSPSNDDLWNDTKNAWFNDQDLNTPFNGRYIEHHDVDKKLYGIPYSNMSNILVYREDLFERYGFEPPRTLEELRTVAIGLRNSLISDGKEQTYGLISRGKAGAGA